VAPPEIQYSVRRASASDLFEVLAVLQQNAPSPPLEGVSATVAISKEQRATWKRILATPNLTVYLAEHGREAVGTACLLVMPNLTYHCQPTAFIEAVVVAYAHRRRGVARLMLGRILDDARAAGCHKVQLLSHKRHADDGGHQLYRSVGFEAEAEGFRLYLSA